jgi:hypothetical protein
MIAWLSWLFEQKPGVDAPAPTALEELRALRIQRRQLINNLCSLRAYGFDTIAQDDEAALKSLDRKILALQLKTGVTDDPENVPADFS